MTLSLQMIIGTILVNSHLYHRYQINIVTMVKLQIDRRIDTVEVRFLDPSLNSLGDSLFQETETYFKIMSQKC